MPNIFVEHAAIPDIFASGLAFAEDIGDGNFRFTFYVNHTSIHDGSRERDVVCRLIMPAQAIKAAVDLTLQGIGMMRPIICHDCTATRRRKAVN